MKRFFAVMVIFAMCFMLASCSKDNNSLVGQWVHKSGSKSLEESITFKKDGTGSADGFPVSWYTETETIDGKKWDVLHISHVFGKEEFCYKISGNQLLLIDPYDNTTESIYVKK